MRTIHTALLATALMLSGCGDFLKEYSQDTDYVRSWQDLNETLIGDCYMPQFQANDLSRGNDKQYFIHFLADELEEMPQGFDAQQMAYDEKEKVFGYYTWQARNGQNDTYTGYNDDEADNWTQVYKLINVANNIIYSATQVPQNTDAERTGVLKVDGEARFLRAYYYFWLVNLYAKPYQEATAATDPGVPLKTSETVEDHQFTRATVQEVYDLILSDLAQAEEELAQVGRQPSVYRADVTAVRFLLSRVHLYMQHWDLAASYAQMVIDARPALVDLRRLAVGRAFLSPSSAETIFSMGGNQMPEMTKPYYKGFTISPEIYDLYQPGDLRSTRFMWRHGSFIGYTKLEARAENPQTTTDDENYYLEQYYLPWNFVYCDISDKFTFRTAEAYLTLAEAEAYMGHDDAARQAVNTLRRTRFENGAEADVADTGDQLIRLIRDERERELCLEGQRWFDLRRYAVCSVSPQTTTIHHDYYYYTDRSEIEQVECHHFTLAPDDWGWTLAIPQEVIDFNHMEQNPRGERTHTVTQ